MNSIPVQSKGTGTGIGVGGNSKDRSSRTGKSPVSTPRKILTPPQGSPYRRREGGELRIGKLKMERLDSFCSTPNKLKSYASSPLSPSTVRSYSPLSICNSRSRSPISRNISRTQLNLLSSASPCPSPLTKANQLSNRKKKNDLIQIEKIEETEKKKEKGKEIDKERQKDKQKRKDKEKTKEKEKDKEKKKAIVILDRSREEEGDNEICQTLLDSIPYPLSPCDPFPGCDKQVISNITPASSPISSSLHSPTIPSSSKNNTNNHNNHNNDNSDHNQNHIHPTNSTWISPSSPFPLSPSSSSSPTTPLILKISHNFDSAISPVLSERTQEEPLSTSSVLTSSTRKFSNEISPSSPTTNSSSSAYVGKKREDKSFMRAFGLMGKKKGREREKNQSELDFNKVKSKNMENKKWGMKIPLFNRWVLRDNETNPFPPPMSEKQRVYLDNGKEVEGRGHLLSGISVLDPSNKKEGGSTEQEEEEQDNSDIMIFEKDLEETSSGKLISYAFDVNATDKIPPSSSRSMTDYHIDGVEEDRIKEKGKEKEKERRSSWKFIGRPRTMWNGDDKRKKEKNRNNKEIIHNSSNNNNDNNNNEKNNIIDIIPSPSTNINKIEMMRIKREENEKQNNKIIKLKLDQNENEDDNEDKDEEFGKDDVARSCKRRKAEKIPSISRGFYDYLKGRPRMVVNRVDQLIRRVSVRSGSMGEEEIDSKGGKKEVMKDDVKVRMEMETKMEKSRLQEEEKNSFNGTNLTTTINTCDDIDEEGEEEEEEDDKEEKEKQKQKQKRKTLLKNKEINVDITRNSNDDKKEKLSKIDKNVKEEAVYDRNRNTDIKNDNTLNVQKNTFIAECNIQRVKHLDSKTGMEINMNTNMNMRNQVQDPEQNERQKQIQMQGQVRREEREKIELNNLIVIKDNQHIMHERKVSEMVIEKGKVVINDKLSTHDVEVEVEVGEVSISADSEVDWSEEELLIRAEYDAMAVKEEKAKMNLLDMNKEKERIRLIEVEKEKERERVRIDEEATWKMRDEMNIVMRRNQNIEKKNDIAKREEDERIRAQEAHRERMRKEEEEEDRRIKIIGEEILRRENEAKNKIRIEKERRIAAEYEEMKMKEEKERKFKENEIISMNEVLDKGEVKCIGKKRMREEEEDRAREDAEDELWKEKEEERMRLEEEERMYYYNYEMERIREEEYNQMMYDQEMYEYQQEQQRLEDELEEEEETDEEREERIRIDIEIASLRYAQNELEYSQHDLAHITLLERYYSPYLHKIFTAENYIEDIIAQGIEENVRNSVNNSVCNSSRSSMRITRTESNKSEKFFVPNSIENLNDKLILVEANRREQDRYIEAEEEVENYEEEEKNIPHSIVFSTSSTSSNNPFTSPYFEVEEEAVIETKEKKCQRMVSFRPANEVKKEEENTLIINNKKGREREVNIADKNKTNNKEMHEMNSLPSNVIGKKVEVEVEVGVREDREKAGVSLLQVLLLEELRQKEEIKDELETLQETKRKEERERIIRIMSDDNIEEEEEVEEVEMKEDSSITREKKEGKVSIKCVGVEYKESSLVEECSLTDGFISVDVNKINYNREEHNTNQVQKVGNGKVNERRKEIEKEEVRVSRPEMTSSSSQLQPLPQKLRLSRPQSLPFFSPRKGVKVRGNNDICTEQKEKEKEEKMKRRNSISKTVSNIWSRIRKHSTSTSTSSGPLTTQNSSLLSIDTSGSPSLCSAVGGEEMKKEKEKEKEVVRVTERKREEVCNERIVERGSAESIQRGREGEEEIEEWSDEELLIRAEYETVGEEGKDEKDRGKKMGSEERKRKDKVEVDEEGEGEGETKIQLDVINSSMESR